MSPFSHSNPFLRVYHHSSLTVLHHFFILLFNNNSSLLVHQCLTMAILYYYITEIPHFPYPMIFRFKVSQQYFKTIPYSIFRMNTQLYFDNHLLLLELRSHTPYT